MRGACGVMVIGVDGAPPLLAVARERARSRGLDAEFIQGDLLELPVANHAADVVLSVFGVIFAPDRARAFEGVARAAAPGARAFITAWVPAGPINDMLAALGRAGPRGGARDRGIAAAALCLVRRRGRGRAGGRLACQTADQAISLGH